TFKDFWAHDRIEEGEALRQLIAFFAQHLKEHPNAHVYHYAAYETSALRRLSSSHGIGEDLVDQMLRENRFVDLYSVVSGGLIASEPAYSLKNLEVFYMEARTGEVKTAGGSVVAYENWRESQDQKILDEIRDYNRVDCVSTQKLRDWLIYDVRPAGLPWRQAKSKAGPGGGFDSRVVDRGQIEADALRNRLNVVREGYGDRIANLLFDLVYFHRREKKPAWWNIFDKMGKEAEDLVEDFDCLGGLVAETPADDAGKSWERMYQFPEQDTKLEEGECHVAAGGLPAPVALVELNLSKRTAKVRFPKARFDGAPDSTAILPTGPLRTDAIEAAIVRVVDSIVCGDQKYAAIVDYISKSKPRFLSKGRQTAVINPSLELVPETVAAVSELDRSALPI